jgi:hypothetical protein
MIVVGMLGRCFLLLQGTCRASSFGCRNTRCLLSSSPFFFIGTNEGGGENGSLDVFAMRDKGSGG